MKDTKIRCVKDLPPFEVGKIYRSDSRLFTNKEDSDDNQVIIIESTTDDDMENCHLVPLKKVHEHFIVIKELEKYESKNRKSD